VSDDLQFGFKYNYSTAMCSMVLREVITPFANSRIGVCCTFLDESKAPSTKPYAILLSRNVPPLVFWAAVERVYSGQLECDGMTDCRIVSACQSV
jgi:hypothetical protein